ncbi:uncharacterized protein LOC8083026 [Sorghum bicolor]|uniref:DUF7866 domain-containing protein n=1 Tax=Sorghum bicolor TaxID=4558 RepID=C5Y3K4_SORBI|nr:uncharacterized protein LOC8083026 [Sorghum bicolor]EES09157.2 hypothetical protein SORBI_3005G016800 [Sorghum bicolor]|eukprot:XP_002450169.2 uncharacterized protein LOC8083026 [Sorghum bicolor]
MARRRPSAPITMMISLTGFTALSAGLLLIFSSSSSFLLQAQGGASSSEEESSYVPVRRVVYRSMTPAAMTAEAAAAPYEPFEVCEGCRCCASSSSNNGNGSSCVDTSCCYAIDCNLPGKPFGTCAFTPQTCGCGAANNCTQPSS